MSSPARSRLAAFVRELRRRKVIRVGVAYLVVAWLTAQVSATLFPFLHLPPIAVTFVIAMLILGFPLAVVLAWAYDLTPDGLERTGPQEERARRETRTIRTIVALPFANLTRDEEGELFGDGITEELIGAFARVPGLRVVGRTSAFAYKNRPADIREIGERLGVDAALEGSVRKVDRRVRVSVQLTDVEHGVQLWSQTYDRELSDVLALQEDIARSVVAALRLGGAPTNDRLLRAATTNLEAYTLYLRGRHLWARRTAPSLRQASDHFRAAIAADSSYALAHAGLADCLSILLEYGVLDPAHARPQAIAAAERAVTLAPDLAEAHTARALAHQAACEWSAAELALCRAVGIDDDYAVAHQRYALLLAWLGRDADALREIRAAQEVDPMSPIVNTSVGWVHYYGRRHDLAVSEYRRVLEMDADFTNARIGLALALLQAGQAEPAAAELEGVAALTAGHGVLPLLCVAYQRCGRGSDALRAHERLIAAAAHEYVGPYAMAVAALGVGRHEEALTSLEAAVAQRAPQLAYLGTEPLLDPLRVEGRFAALLQRAGLAWADAGQAVAHGGADSMKSM